MKYEEIAAEAATYGVRVCVGSAIRWHAEGMDSAVAWMSPLRGRTWIAFNENGVKFKGTKAKAANWCLDQAANGPV